MNKLNEQLQNSNMNEAELDSPNWGDPAVKLLKGRNYRRINSPKTMKNITGPHCIKQIRFAEYILTPSE